MRLNHVIDVLEDVAASYFSVVEALLHLAIDIVPQPTDVFEQETAQRAEKIGEGFEIIVAEIFAPRSRNPLRQIVIFIIRIVSMDSQSGLSAGQTMTPSRPLDHDLRHIFTHKLSVDSAEAFRPKFNIQDS